MAQPPKITLSNKLLVPEDFVTDEDIQRWHYEWNESIMEPEVDDDDNVVMDEFERPIMNRRTEVRTLRTYKEVFRSNGDIVYMFPRGNLEKIRHFLRRPYRDLRPLAPLGFRLQMAQGTMSDHRWPDQARCVEEWLKTGSGVILGDTGSGKTVIGLSLIHI